MSRGMHCGKKPKTELTIYVRKLKALLWLHALRTKRYFLSTASGSLTDALWMSIFLFGAYSSQGPGFARETYWALVAWAVIANAGWMIGGWVDYLTELGLLEPLEFSGVSPVVAASGRSFVIAVPVSISSLLVLALSYSMGIDALNVKSPGVALASLLLLWAQSTAYGAILAATVLRTSIPAALLDIAALTYLGLLLAPLPPINHHVLALVPLLGPGYIIRLAVAKGAGWTLLASTTLSTLLLAAAALLYTRKTLEHVRRRGFKAVVFQ